MGNGHGRADVAGATRSPILTRSRSAARDNLAASSLPRMETRKARSRRQTAGDCPICLGVQPGGPSARPVPCNHMFHLECLMQWSMVENTCPVCREFFNHIVSGCGPGIAVADAVQVDD